MIVAGWADGYNNSFRTRRGDGASAATACWPGPGRTPTRDRDARPADRPRPRDGRLVRPLAARRGQRVETVEAADT